MDIRQEIRAAVARAREEMEASASDDAWWFVDLLDELEEKLLKIVDQREGGGLPPDSA